MWNTTLSGSVAYPGLARVRRLNLKVWFVYSTCTENELIEFFEGVCIQSVHFTRDRSAKKKISLVFLNVLLTVYPGMGGPVVMPTWCLPVSSKCWKKDYDALLYCIV